MQEKINRRTRVVAVQWTAVSAQVAVAVSAAMAGLLSVGSASAQNFPIAPNQRATAEQVASAGVPLSELAPNAPDNYTVKRGDTLWAISGLFLQSPWRWPELWGMNMQDIRNPHLIYPGQQLYLEKKDGRARLRAGPPETGSIPSQTIRVSPRTRYESLADSAIPTLKPHLIEPFLAEPIVVEENAFAKAPRIVAAQDDRVLITRGNRAYARGDASDPLSDAVGKPLDYRIFRNLTALKEPGTNEVLGYEAQYVGKASLARSESTRETKDKDGKAQTDVIPASIDIVNAKEEIRVGDRLLPEPPRQLQSYAPRAPATTIEGARIVSIYGSAVANAAQNQVVAINRGTRDGIESGHVMAILTDGGRMVDKTDPAKPMIKLPDERNGLIMVFRTFEKVSYALILEIKSGVKVGDRLVNPR
jgi:nucleoid-associated protein YgaU